MRTLLLIAAVILFSGCTSPAKRPMATAPGESITITEMPQTLPQRLKGHFAKKPKVVRGGSVVEGALVP